MDTKDSPLSTEFDALLSTFKRKVFSTLGLGVLFFLLVESLFIFFVVDDKGAIKVQALNGALVMCGGLLVVAVTSLYLILPTKLIAYESLKLVRKSSADMDAFISKASPAVDKADALMTRVEAKMDDVDGKSKQLFLDLREEARMIREELAGLRKAFTTKIESPVKRIQPARLLEPTNGEHAQARAENDGSVSG